MDRDTKSHLKDANFKLLAWQSRSSVVSNSSSVTLPGTDQPSTESRLNRIWLLQNHVNQLYDHTSYIFFLFLKAAVLFEGSVLPLKAYQMDFWRWLAFPMGVLLCCDLQTSAVQKPASHNCTSDGQRISFSHSYKIDLPMSSQIKVEADPLQHEDNSGVQLDPGKAMENEEQNIIFRHNIHVRAPKGDCETLTHIKGLFERIEKLEKEAAELREVCSPHKCCGGSQGK